MFSDLRCCASSGFTQPVCEVNLILPAAPFLATQRALYLRSDFPFLRVEICFNLLNARWMSLLFPKDHCFRKASSLCPFVFLVRAARRWRWVWSAGGMELTGETEVLGEKTVLMPLVQINLRLYWPGSNPGPRGDRLATNCLNHGTRDVLLNV